MANYIAGKYLRRLQYGEMVTKSALTLPASTTATLFTVNSGNVIVTSLVGVVTTVIQTQACTISLGTTPTTGTAENAGIATASPSISALEVGSWLMPQADSMSSGTLTTGQLLSTGHAGTLPFQPQPFIAPPGTITWTTSATNTGAMTWYATYVPLDDGAFLN